MTRADVGMVSAFTGRYPSARLLESFLRKAGHEVERTPATTPDMLEAGTMLSAADYCLPVRTFVGHFHQLLTSEDRPRFVLAPNVCSEDEISSTCSKYRDPGGVALRSLGSSLGYTLARAAGRDRARAAEILGEEETARLVAEGRAWPELLQPRIWTSDPGRMEALGYRLLCRIRDIDPWRRRLAPFVPGPLSERLAPWQEARRVMRETIEQRTRGSGRTIEKMKARPERARLAMVGRVYLLDDPLLTADAKAYFKRAGCEVVTAVDVPAEVLEPAYVAARGYYDSHKRATAFVEWAADLPVDGFVVVSSFGCHPDAFESEWVADFARAMGIPAWYFRFDEQSGSAGFKTRFETILGFIEERRDERTGRRPRTGPSRRRIPVAAGGKSPDVPREPVITWPAFNPLLDLGVTELFHQAGLSRYMLPPLPPTLETIALGEGKYAESCCPYGMTTGSFVQTVGTFLDRVNAEARSRGERPQPRRILLLQGRGEGPCTYGWYSMAQAATVPGMLADRLAEGGHTVEMATLGMKDATRILAEIASHGDRRKLRPLLRIAEEGVLDDLRTTHRNGVGLRVMRSLGLLLKPALKKLAAAEELRAASLLMRAHELERGTTTRAEREGQEVLRAAHGVREIRRARRRALEIVANVPNDPSPRPRVASVGEIYVTLAPFGNRGAVDVLLGHEGVEVVEGNSMTKFFKPSMAELKRRALIRRHGVNEPLQWLWRHGVPLLEEPTNRGPEARPFLWFDVGGEGVRSVAEARALIEDGADGVLHLFPFKCMPEGIAKDALIELCRAYGVRYLALSFGKETDAERLRTEISTYAELLRVEMQVRGDNDDPVTFQRRLRARMRRRHELSDALDACVHSAGLPI